MKILAIGDPHGKLPLGLNSIIKKNKIDIIVCTGDPAFLPKFTNKGPVFLSKKGREKAEKRYLEIVDKLCSYNLPVLILRGNMYTNTLENDRITKALFRRNKNLFYKKVGAKTLGKYDFFFLDMVYEKHTSIGNRYFTTKLRYSSIMEKKLNDLLSKSKKPKIILSHSPPYGILDKNEFNNKHVGSKILLNAIKRHSPEIVFCGHIHEAKGQAKIGKTKIYNLGYCGDFKIINI